MAFYGVLEMIGDERTGRTRTRTADLLERRIVQVPYDGQ